MLKVHSFETLGALDGPGIRFIVFLQGCPLRCKYCHNPDTWDINNGKDYAILEIFNKIKRYVPYFNKNGGVTISGGEPLLQAKKLKELLKLLKENNIKTTLDTSGSVYNNDVLECLNLCDLVILDIKHTNPLEYEKLTGQNFTNVKKVHSYLNEINKKTWIRQVIIDTITNDENQVKNLLNYKTKNVIKIELLPYHSHATPKWEALGLKYELNLINDTTQKTLEKLNEYIER